MRFLRNKLYHLIFLLWFILFVVYEIIIANLRVARAVLTPQFRIQPAIMYLPLRCKSDIQITILANIISLTPGTLTLEISPDKKKLLLHTMFFDTKKKQVNELRRKFERPIMELFP